MRNDSRTQFIPTVLVLTMGALAAPRAQATSLPLGAAANYAVLYEGTGAHNVQIKTNGTVNGNIGVSGLGKFDFPGPGTINGRLDFSAANSLQYHNTNGSNVGPTSVNYNIPAVTNAVNTVNSLSASLGGETGTNITIKGNQTINASAGTLDGNGNRVFNVTSYSEAVGNVVTIKGDGSGDPVVFNFGFNRLVDFRGDVTLSGLSDDQVLWNFAPSVTEVSLLGDSGSTAPLATFQGVILAPNSPITISHANLDGRVFGTPGDMVIDDRAVINAPADLASEPEPSTLCLLGLVSLCLAGYGLQRRLAMA
jgi:choice-of-anchor A domain-containing protein